MPVDALLLAISCLGLIRLPGAFAAAVAALVALKLFFDFVYISYYRHEVLYLLFLVSLYWMAAEGAGGSWRSKVQLNGVQFAGAAVFFGVLMFQSGRLLGPIRAQFSGAPFSRAADVGELLKRPELSRAIVMVRAGHDTGADSLSCRQSLVVPAGAAVRRRRPSGQECAA